MKKGFRFAIGFILCSLQIVCFSQKKTNYKTIETSINVIYDICFTKSGQAIGIADDNSIKVYSIETNELIREFEGGHNKQILSIDISKDSTLLVSGGKDSTIVIWNFLGGKILKSFKSNGIITSVCISPNGQYLVYGGTENKVFVYDIPNEKLIGEFSEHSDDITSIVFSPDGQYFASSSGDKTINIYKNKTLVTTLSGHKDWVRGISFNSENTKLISCSDDGKIIMWNISDINNPRIINESKLGFNWILSVDFNHDDRTYAFADFKGNAEIVGQFGSYKTNIKAPINKILFKPNEVIYLKIAIATRGKGVLLIDAKNMKSKH